jgi:DNA-binding FadR family transcriptional regulator
MSPLDLPTGSRRYLQIARQLAVDIESGRYTAGERLPPERELAQTIDVSRTTVREALLALEIMRFIEIKVGAGVYVLDVSKREPSDLSEPDSAAPSEVLSARRLIEAETAALSALNATPAQLDKLRQANDRMAETIDNVAAFDAADALFHELVAKAAGNDVLSSFVSKLWRMRDSAMWTFWYDQTRHPDNRRQSVEDHRAILRAFERRNADAARTAMQAHLDVLANRFYELKL